MNGTFEIGKTSYPIGYLNKGEFEDGKTAYVITDMRTLETLDKTLLTLDAAVVVANRLNNGYRTQEFPTMAHVVKAIPEQIKATYPDLLPN